MAFAVRKWPNSVDPRRMDFAVEGFAPDAVPAYRYTLKTTGALAPFDDLNAGINIPFVQGEFGFHQFGRVGQQSGDPDDILGIEGHEIVIVGPPDWSILWSILVTRAGGLSYNGLAVALFPNAILGWPTVAVTSGVGGTNHVPNPIEIIPRPFNYPLTP